MNRNPLWKNATVIIALVLGLLYTLPNLFGEVPAVQISSVKATVKLDLRLQSRIEEALAAAAVKPTGLFFEPNSIRVRLADTDTQLKAKDVIERALNPDPADASYSVALNLLSASPDWLTSLQARPMYLGLDLRGGVHFLLEVDMKGALTKRLDSTSADLRTLLRDKNIRHGGIVREGNMLSLRFRDADSRDKARLVLTDNQPDLDLVEGQDGTDFKLIATLKPVAQKRIQEFALKQNITTLNNRINELGVAEPVIQQQGADRIVVQLPGVQDTAKAKDILGRTATLEVRLVDDEASANQSIMEQAARGQPPAGTDYYVERGGSGLLVKKQVVLTGERLTDAQAGFDSQTQEPAVHLSLDSAGARIFKDVTRDNVNKRMAILLVEKGKGEVVTAPVIRTEIGGGRVQISGRMTTTEANDVALLLRAGSLAAPMDIIEERTIGPSLGADNIAKGVNSTLWGFAAIAVFMSVYYLLFGFVSVTALSANLLFLVGLLSLLQATLTLPGIAAIALTLGMAIDANVLINERVREELRNGVTPQAAITAGYERAWSTILDANITTMIAGIALLIFGSGPVRGFAVVLCLGILTSIFSAVVVSRTIVNFIYGSRRKLESISIGQIWKPGA
ncbi:MAG: protein translocase subunit SecD [Gammaproteobacteria bacterium]|nr:protein translocase subunit SecD [Rhodocyclaceae bacterium]MBU3909602.1 protein translocase subunit SecD [Gammaproteobacteria bacterium]MBU3987933.1 protein translocase subunit SecD [Gammaproteobacteria bacterium]MBU4003265.1 protein translocase subunit SecD [Gammaproteobacteria bacterium]MBU4022314.1 protein translocase subunit SecD [Gammaproteobacteria bacterium]